MLTRTATLVEVGPRDGFQSIGPVIPTDLKIDLIQRLYASGLRRMEATAFVSPAAVPQLADAEAILAATRKLPFLDTQVLVPNARHAERALAAGATHLAFVLSVSERHNRSNVKRSPLESLDEYRSIIAMLPLGTAMRLNLATAFDCPFTGAVDSAETLRLLDSLLTIKTDAEVCLCDTTGRVTPDRVKHLFDAAQQQFSVVKAWAFHAHDTYGLGVANVLSAMETGINIFDASFGGLGGCPFAPGATGNVATEDLVWTFQNMGIQTSVDIAALVRVAVDGAALTGSLAGGRVRDALGAALCRKKV
jgi:hydroxymethylglutaryl-CoA lyase